MMADLVDDDGDKIMVAAITECKESVIWNPNVRKSVGIVILKAGYNVFGFGVCPDTSDPMLAKMSVAKIPTIWEVEVFVNGVIHFGAYHLDHGFRSDFVILFDFKSEKFGEVCLPERLVPTPILEVTKGLLGSKKLKLGALSLYVGDGRREAVEAIGNYHLELLGRLVIVLNNYHYAPSINRGKCLSCMPRKMPRKPYSHQVERPKDLLGLIHTDVCSPFRIMSRQRANYFVTFTDDFSYYGYVYLLKHKHKVFETFKIFQKEIENQLGKTIKSLCFDRGERRNQTLIDMVQSMMSQTTLPKSFWDYSLKSAARIVNMVPTQKVDKTPYEIPHGQAPKIPFENKVFVAWNTEFFENDLIHLKASGSVKDLELIQEEDTNPSLYTSLDHKEDDQEIDKPQSDINPIRKSSRTRHAPYRMCLYIDDEEHELWDLSEPANYKGALLDL
nr:hypothetical protein [Tanacetum cinerariifolium]